MNPEYSQKKLEASLKHLGSAGLTYGNPLVADPGRMSKASGSSGSEAGTTKFSIPLAGDLGAFDISLMNTGLMALREYDPTLNAWKIVAYQGNPEHLVDLAKDMLVGFRCSHLIETPIRVH